MIRARYSEGFKAPTLFQLFSEFGNDALAPEQADAWEAGAEQRFLSGAVSIGGTYFERRTTDQIIFSSCTATSANPLCVRPGTTIRRSGYYQNIARAFARGVEAVAQARIGTRLAIDGNYNWIESEDRSAGATFDNAANTIRLAPCTLVDLPLSHEVRLFARAENVFDEDYATAFRYGTLDRSIHAGLRDRFWPGER